MARIDTVYVVASRRRVKVGIPGNMERRFRELRYWGRATKIIRTWHRPDDARKIEFNARRLLQAYSVLGFDWFRVGAEQACWAVDEAIALVEAGRGQKTPRELKVMEDERRAEVARRTAEGLADFRRRYAAGEFDDAN